MGDAYQPSDGAHMSVKYAVNEHFYTWQGEGVHMGRAAYFIRLQGCDQACWFCDSASTWHKDWLPEGIFLGDRHEVADLVDAPHGVPVVLTGGEPCMYDLDPLIELFKYEQVRDVHIETAGHRPLPRGATWVTLSPKPFAAHPLRESVDRADEFKIIISDDASLDNALDCLALEPHDTRPIWLHPEWGHSDRAGTLDTITRAVKAEPKRFRAGWQLHKLYQADNADGKPVNVAPLGGTHGTAS